MDYKQIIDKTPARKTYGEYTQLIADGSFWKGPCPLCDNPDESFLVIAENKEFYCYACHRFGNLILFISEVESITLKNAAQFLMNRWGILLVDEWPPKPQNDLMDRYEPVFKKRSKK